MKKLDLNQPENIEGGKFWGIDPNCGDCINGKMECQFDRYIFWIRVDSYPEPIYC
jgi:hypothetical protein